MYLNDDVSIIRSIMLGVEVGVEEGCNHAQKIIGIARMIG